MSIQWSVKTLFHGVVKLKYIEHAILIECMPSFVIFLIISSAAVTK